MSELDKTIKEYYKAENRIIDMLDDLENAGDECNCDDCKKIDLIHEGEWKEITTRCLNCGGYIENV